MRHNIQAGYGWLSPDGKLYACQWAHHFILAVEIMKNIHGLDTNDWIHDSDRQWQADDKLYELGYMKMTNERSVAGYGWWPTDRNPTQAQINTIFEWAEVNEAVVPDWILNKET